MFSWLPPPWDQMLAVALGGAIGSLARFLAGSFFGALLGTVFPFATLFVNVTGSMWLGWIGALAIAKPTAVDPVLRLFLTTGFAGGFTTFSTFTFETIVLYQRGDAILAWANILANFVLALFGAWLGTVIARAQGA